jgi:cytochrome c oxidase subunit 4
MSEHIVSRKLYLLIFAALMVLTVVTVLAAQRDFGRLNDIIAMAIAVTKATLVVLFFMHVRYSSRLTKVVVVSGFFWLAIFVVLTMSDYLSRTFAPSDPPAPGVQETYDQHRTPSG